MNEKDFDKEPLTAQELYPDFYEQSAEKAEDAATDDAASPTAKVSYDPDVYPGTPLRWGSSGIDVVNMQTRLNNASKTYTAINSQAVDGKFGQNMYNATVRFQKQHGLNPDGVIGQLTWNKIVAVDKALNGGGYVKVTTPYPGYVISIGASGDSVRFIQSYMGAVPGLFPVTIDGIFGKNTQYLVRSFQSMYRLKVDGLVGSATWATMIQVFNSIH